MKTIKILSPDQSETLANHLQSQCDTNALFRNVARDACMIFLMLDAGLRVGEVCGLRRSDLWFGEGPVIDLTIPSVIAKNGLERVVPLSDRLRNSIRLLYYWFWKISGPDFAGPAFHRYNTSSNPTTRQVQRIVKQITHDCLGESFNPHALRHTFATKMMHLADMRTVQTLLGHKSITSTQVYTHPNLHDLRTAINKTNGTAQQTV